VICTLDDVLITAELSRRSARTPDYESEARALAALAQELARDPHNLLQHVVDTALRVCRAGSAGISILESGSDRRSFRWSAIAGDLAHHVDRMIPDEASPSAEVIARHSALLFDRPARRFPALDIDPPIHEMLLVPCSLNGAPIGTLWAIGHTSDRRFDAEDARLLASLAAFAAVAWQTGVAERKRAADTLRDSEQRRRLALDVAELGTWTWDLATGTGDIDARGAEIVGLEPGTIGDIAAAQRSRVHPDDIARLEEEVVRGIESREIFTLEYRTVHRDGSLRYVDSRAVAITDEDGRLVRLTGTNRDATHERTLESALRASEARLQAALDASNMGTFVWHVLEDRAEPDVRMLRLFGLPPDGVLNLRIALTTLIHPDDRERYAAAVHEAIAPGGSGTLREDIRVVHADGALRWLAVIGQTTFEGSPRRATRLVGMVADITSRKSTEQALRDSEERLKESDRRKDEFLAMLAHELRNPLAPIRTGLELIRLAGDTPDAVERVRETMERQVGHMVRLIDDLLDVSRIRSGKIELQRKPTPLADLVNSAVEANRAAFTAEGLHLTIDLPDEPCTLDVDPTRVVQVLSNLLHNAAKFTPSGGHVALKATCAAPTTESGQGDVVLTVSDDGIGISKEMLPLVFDLFTQGEQASTQSQRGLGIGLALARRLVEMHGGSIDAASAGPDLGSTFTVRLPTASRAALVDTIPATGTFGKVTRRVVIVDDNEDAARLMAMLVDELGGDTRVAHDGQAAIRAVSEFLPDVVLLDIGMPGLDGYETCRRIRMEQGARDVVIVAVTGWGQDEDKQRALESGFDAHLTKPADPAALERILAGGSLADLQAD
jgi:PAS domain S-box-containing protein